jgi:hypothetical protein
MRVHTGVVSDDVLTTKSLTDFLSRMRDSYNQSRQPSGYGNSYGRGPSQRPSMPPRPPIQEDTLKSATLQIERKSYIFTLKENERGRFLRITEDTGGRRNNVIIPSTGLEEFKKVADALIQAAKEMPQI